jgi:hypothetical protein
MRVQAVLDLPGPEPALPNVILETLISSGHIGRGPALSRNHRGRQRILLIDGEPVIPSGPIGKATSSAATSPRVARAGPAAERTTMMRRERLRTEALARSSLD